MNKKHLEATLILLVLMIITKASTNAQDIATLTEITLNDDQIVINGVGASADSRILRITEPGTYQLSGTLTEGQILVHAEGAVTLILDHVAISAAQAPPIQIQNAQSATITLSEGSSNTLHYTFNDDEDIPNAALFSEADLTLNGNGELLIEAIAGDGIHSETSITIQDAPTLNINAGDDAIQAETQLMINGGTFHLITAGGIYGTPDDDLSAKGLKSDADILINGGDFIIDALDDAIHADQNTTINGGTFTLSALGKAVNVEYTLLINGGDITILTSDEGLEAGFITINDGYIHITAIDDGINISEPDDIPNTSLYYLYIHGGVIVINAEGDGIDSNGSIEMTGGLVIVNGPTQNADGAIDYDGIFDIHGGTLIAVGSAGMPAAPGDGSSQHSVLVNLEETLPARTLINLQSAEGESLLTFAPTKPYQSIVFSSPALQEGQPYQLYYGGQVEGEATDGLYADGPYTTGTEYASFTISGALTQVGEMRWFRGWGGELGGPPTEGRGPRGDNPPGQNQPPRGPGGNN
jgi:hypothetical protein